MMIVVMNNWDIQLQITVHAAFRALQFTPMESPLDHHDPIHMNFFMWEFPVV